MRLIGTLLVICMVFAVMKLAVMALLIALGIRLLVATLKHPREALGFMLMLATMSLIEAHPWIALVGFSATAMVTAIGK
ncbi:hypothetical protein A0J57_21050 [Sphingobium sp. 22B]|uniref:hypothetical protein n=1 Tax=unclassified Sphingobium TaxID=2611147 RepID=UPI000785CCFD|nr:MULTISPECIES: hypothetical protein [unclassified Sphingobium]KXU30232.1 hypothetical protein AXW74_18660 [Sphingobium sp. AM]KYC30321.1 hypothetical protein A0J57_21050 [Sphingobium sp. 22B]MCB4862728.1 hypothetical protein [Sphingobium sp. PNB]OAP29912.1 hypothetical protein A8O16_21025 [Sphingobium sp. 20006FA]